jgi:hypothetical protein
MLNMGQENFLEIKKKIKITTIILAIVALTIYVSFYFIVSNR